MHAIFLMSIIISGLLLLGFVSAMLIYIALGSAIELYLEMKYEKIEKERKKADSVLSAFRYFGS